jgi:hypothetical protein
MIGVYNWIWQMVIKDRPEIIEGDAVEKKI